MLEIIGGIIALVGSLFLLLASIGIIRMPDAFNRMQTGTKATTLGSLLFMTGIAMARPEWSGKMVLLMVFILFSNPLSSHALARAAHKFGIPLGEKAVCDHLKDDQIEEDDS
ncbi:MULTISPECIES: monovalent cation/H(+) antiporter subunit G [unclassified Oceanispirochaeta]|uniref:monovalent cation/H(+) antiporter subunit G n=1 Tax=unclassified Oceanispirochaeta TaxID=2635722 RepID=UPI000E094AC7|nr:MULTISPECIES: monovalent cation/H(+) antiporter subunit G [unclassified Oceanispirochaeta]MBF9014352.1 monovalent cation/H(+) antiporter subunit G [Oceanispirochaeta sp. M2]NPD71238.1 monovalent cation/H(+) antiporter subunit G [Oceanispirochaeta sp. M1]RDG33623.1 monovalent cation/H(+) antiporter subunit G [Oceanispirochaeta sp. M1]